MSHDPLVASILEQPAPEVPAETVALPTPEQAQAADHAFSRNEEANTVAALLGMHAGVLLLHDLAVENFQVPPEEEKRRKKKPRHGDPDGPPA